MIAKKFNLPFLGAVISPYYDSLLCKVIAHANTITEASAKMSRCLSEFRVRGVKTNIPFLLNVLKHEKFQASTYDTNFIDNNPQLFHYKPSKNRGQKLLTYLSEVMVNGPKTKMSTNLKPAQIVPTIPYVDNSQRKF